MSYSLFVVTLAELSVGDARALVDDSVASFVDDLVESGAGRDRASTAIDNLVRWLLPDGVLTTGHRFRSIEDSGRRVGWLWFGPTRESADDYFLFEITIDEELRGQGVGRAAVELVVGELEELDVDRLGVNVFDSAPAAVALYETLGFEAATHSGGQREMWLHVRQPN